MEDTIVCHLSYENGTRLLEKILDLLKDLFSHSRPIYLYMNERFDEKIRGKTMYGVKEGRFAKGLTVKEIGDLTFISEVNSEKLPAVQRIHISNIVRSHDRAISDERFYDSIIRTMTSSKSKSVKLKYRCIVLYIELILHELGHVYYGQNLVWNMSDYIQAVNRMMELAFREIEIRDHNVDTESAFDLSRKRYRIKISESLADGFARSYLLYVVQNIPDIMKYFEFMSVEKYVQRKQESRESDE